MTLPPISLTALAGANYALCWGALSLWRLAPATDRSSVLAVYMLGIAGAAAIIWAQHRYLLNGKGHVAAWTVLMLAVAWSMVDQDAEGPRAMALLLLAAGFVACTARVWRFADFSAASCWVVVTATEIMGVLSRYGCKFGGYELVSGAAAAPICEIAHGATARNAMIYGVLAWSALALLWCGYSSRRWR